MADFPGKVNTQTSSPQSQTEPMNIMNVSVDFNFVKSVTGILLLVEISPRCCARLFADFLIKDAMYDHIITVVAVVCLFRSSGLFVAMYATSQAFGLLVWALISSAFYWYPPAYGWVLFVSITLWILTLVLFIMLILGMRLKLPSIPWPITLLVFYVVASALYFTAFLANVVSIHYFQDARYNHMAAGAFFSVCVTVAYIASAVFAYLEWKGDGGNAAMTTVPV